MKLRGFERNNILNLRKKEIGEARGEPGIYAGGGGGGGGRGMPVFRGE